MSNHFTTTAQGLRLGDRLVLGNATLEVESLALVRLNGSEFVHVEGFLTRTAGVCGPQSTTLRRTETVQVREA